MQATGMTRAAEAAALVPAGARVFLSGCAAEPRVVLDAVAADPDLWRGVTLTGAFIPGVNDSDFTAFGRGTRVETIFATAGLRSGPGRPEIMHLPLHYSAFWHRLARPGLVDVAIVTVAPPRADGSVGLGLAADFAPAAVAAGARLIGVVHPDMPDVRHGPRLPASRFAALVEGAGPLPGFDPGPADAEGRAIAGHVLSLLGPGDTLQLGLGKVQVAMLEALAGAAPPGLGFHAGMIAGPILPLLEAGLLPRGVTTGVALGPPGFGAQVARRDDIRFATVAQTHGAAALAAVPNLLAVNSAVEVDLLGQANAEALGTRQISGHGGIMDFLRGARLSPGGRSVLALPATARGGSQSRIVAGFAPGTPVAVPRADVDFVVTEHGVADLRDACVETRAMRLLAIADPRFRDTLGAEWEALRRRPHREASKS